MLSDTFRNFYWSLFLVSIIIAMCGVLFIYSASHDLGNYYLKQIVWIAAGLILLFAVVMIGYRNLLTISYILYTLSILVLILVLVLGKTRLGAQRWINLGFVAIQPSEFCKITLILALANYLGKKDSRDFQAGKLFGAFCLTFLPMLLILKQPDLGTAVIFLPVLFCILFVWGVRFRYLLGTAVLGAVGVPIFWHLLKEYQKRRLLVFLNPDIDPLGAGYTAIQSKIAVGSGGVFGKGWLHGTQNRLHFLPEHHTDFIFSVIGEEWGFLGAFLLILLFFILFSKAISVIENTTDIKGKLLATGIVSMLFFHVFINIGMTIGLMPITGLPLPLVSYGGSSMLANFIALGLLISVYKERSIF